MSPETLSEYFIASLHLESFMWGRGGFWWLYGDQQYSVTEGENGQIIIEHNGCTAFVSEKTYYQAVRQWRRNNVREGYRTWLPSKKRAIGVKMIPRLYRESTFLTAEGLRFRYSSWIEKRAVQRRKEMALDPILKHVLKAEPFLDAYIPEGHWKASVAIRCAYYLMATAHDKSQRDSAGQWVMDILDEARGRYRNGFFANPFGDPVAR